MRRLALVAGALIAGVAALLIPSGAQGVPPAGINGNQSFVGSVTSPINVHCAAGADFGSATFTLTLAQGSGGGSTGSDTGASTQANKVNVTWPTGTYSFNFYGSSNAITDTAFPCPDLQSTDVTVDFVFQAVRGSTNKGTPQTVKPTTHRADSAS